MLYRKINFWLIVSMLFGSLWLACIEYIDIERFFVYFGLCFLIVFPFIFSRTKYKLSDKGMMLYYIFIFLADYFGCVCMFYQNIWWWDIVIHFMAGILIYVLAMFILKVNNININIWFSMFFGIVMVMGFSAIWEVYEFLCDISFGLNMQNSLCTGVFDTMKDMIMALVGGIVSMEVGILKIGEVKKDS